MNRKEQWIDQTLKSLDGIQQATTNREPDERFISRINAKNAILRKPGAAFVWKIAATILILVTLNVMTGILIKSAYYGNETTEATSAGYLDYLTPIEF